MAQIAPVRAYRAPKTIAECLDVLEREAGRVVILAGGQSILPLLKTRSVRPEVLLDLRYVTELNALDVLVDEGGTLDVGATRTHRQLWTDPVVRQSWSAVSDAAACVGDRQIQNRGTLGGNLVFGTVTTDMKQVAMCLDAEMTVVNTAGERKVAALDIFSSTTEGLIEPHEILRSVRFPSLGRGCGSAYLKYGITANGRPVVGVAALVVLDDKGQCTSARVVVGGLVPTPNVAHSAAAALEGKAVTEDAIGAAADAAAAEIKPQSDGRATAAHRRQLVRGYARKALALAATRAQEDLERWNK